jgi:hypothetical protein
MENKRISFISVSNIVANKENISKMDFYLIWSFDFLSLTMCFGTYTPDLKITDCAREMVNILSVITTEWADDLDSQDAMVDEMHKIKLRYYDPFLEDNAYQLEITDDDCQSVLCFTHKETYVRYETPHTSIPSIETSVLLNYFKEWLYFLEARDAKSLFFYDTVIAGILTDLKKNHEPLLKAKEKMPQRYYDLLLALDLFKAEKNKNFPPKIDLKSGIPEAIQKLREKEKSGHLLLREQFKLDYLQKIEQANTLTDLDKLLAELEGLLNVDNDTRKYLLRIGQSKRENV